MIMEPQEKIEILPVSLLDQHRPLVESLRRYARSLGLGLGWHYLLDLTWIITHLEATRNERVLDAGAGTGLLQWFLADQGVEVMSVDRTSRAFLPIRFRSRFQVRGLRECDLSPPGQAIQHALSRPVSLQSKIFGQVKDLTGSLKFKRSPGSVTIYNQDINNLEDIREASFDAVVSVSALEHNSPEGLEQVISELMRVLKPGGTLLATMCIARDEDWYHEPSHGWIYTGPSLRRLFNLSDQVVSNYDLYDELFMGLKECAELRDNLDSFYYQSADNGMPWGIWEPMYQVVGVCKMKATGK